MTTTTKPGEKLLTYSASELSRIIRTCAEAGVTSLEIGDIKIAFIDKVNNLKQTQDSDHTVQEVKEFKDDELEPTVSEQDTNELLMLTDSHKWEQTLRAEETEETYHVGASPAL